MIIIMSDDSLTYHLNRSSLDYRKYLSNRWYSTTPNHDL
jgi:hypothetical protein